mmetsp:Transcript_3954/g.14959  ORF Transcript_3954/g.14959 Transcript_3954/m.14959 type:complete len:134 (+) Transcript_3954:4809-5210(+)
MKLLSYVKCTAATCEFCCQLTPCEMMCELAQYQYSYKHEIFCQLYNRLHEFRTSTDFRTSFPHLAQDIVHTSMLIKEAMRVTISTIALSSKVLAAESVPPSSAGKTVNPCMNAVVRFANKYSSSASFTHECFP